MTFNLVCVNIILVRFGLLSGHLLGKVKGDQLRFGENQPSFTNHP